MNRAGSNTPGAADARGLQPLQSIFFRKCQNCVVVLITGTGRWEPQFPSLGRPSESGAVLGIAATECDDIFDFRTDGYHNICAFATAEPSTVTLFWIKGIPVFI